MRYVVVALDASQDGRGTPPQQRLERRISEALTWDSPVTAVEVPPKHLERGLHPYELARLGLNRG